MTTHILTVVGARPQFIKASVVSAAIDADDGFRETLVHTGQHYDHEMSAVFFSELGMREPDLDLGIGSGPHGAQTGAMLAALETAVVEHQPDHVLVYGDTNSTLAGALAAVKLGVPVAHVEAGLRSFNREMPEEINRVVTDHVADLLFAPTDDAVRNLRAEGIPEERIARVGDVMYDVALRFGDMARSRTDLLDRLGLDGDFVLATVHRAENTDDSDRFAAIVAGLALAAERRPVVWPVHPRSLKALERAGLDTGNVHTIDPVGYLDMVMLESSAAVIATDSGGVQKEAFFHGTPCVTLRDETEWVELVTSGWNVVCPPTDARSIAAAIDSASRPAERPDLYGTGNAATEILARLRP